MVLRATNWVQVYHKYLDLRELSPPRLKVAVLSDLSSEAYIQKESHVRSDSYWIEEITSQNTVLFFWHGFLWVGMWFPGVMLVVLSFLALLLKALGAPRGSGVLYYFHLCCLSGRNQSGHCDRAGGFLKIISQNHIISFELLQPQVLWRLNTQCIHWPQFLGRRYHTILCMWFLPAGTSAWAKDHPTR